MIIVTHGARWQGGPLPMLALCGLVEKKYLKGINMTIELKPCVLCRTQPATFPTNINFKGCLVNVWVTECDQTEDPDYLPFVEHNITIYGKDEKQAGFRWNQLMRDLDPTIRTSKEDFE